MSDTEVAKFKATDPWEALAPKRSGDHSTYRESFDLAHSVENPESGESKATAPAAAHQETIIERVATFVERFVFLKTKSLYTLAAAWIVGTHLHAEFEYYGYLFACSPERGSGKSRLLEMLDLLVANSSGIIISPSEAVLFRSAQGRTQILDEVDGLNNLHDLKNTLKAGFHVGGKVPRLVEAEGDYKIEYFPVYAPRALAGIGRTILDDATRDRTFVIEMVRQTKGERREPLRLRRTGAEAQALKKDIETWAATNTESVKTEYDRTFPYLENFRDRTIDVTEPLAAILEVCYWNHPARKRVISDLVEAVELTRKDEGQVVDDHRVIQTLAEVAKTEDPLVGNASELAEKCGRVTEEAPDHLLLGSVLRKYGFDQKSIRNDAGVRRRFSLRLMELVEILDRYAETSKTSEYRPSDAEPGTNASSSTTDVVAVVSLQEGPK
jgi:hypothetical protein